MFHLSRREVRFSALAFNWNRGLVLVTVKAFLGETILLNIKSIIAFQRLLDESPIASVLIDTQKVRVDIVASNLS